MNFTRLLLPVLFSVGLMACEAEFDSYNDVQGLRLLALGADKPELLPGESATLAALVSEDASYAWSWCPLAGPYTEGYECAIAHAQLQQFADEILAQPIVIPDYDLGSAETAVFAHDIPPLFFQAICQLILSADVPDGFDLPSCESNFEIQITLSVSAGSQSITGISPLRLLLDSETAANQNPVLGGIEINEPGQAPVLLDPAQATPMKRGVLYEMNLDISEDSAESFVKPAEDGEPANDAQENLVVTWFHEGGEMDKSHTSYLPGSIGIDILRKNEWTAPTAEDHPESAARLYFVLRDSRDGITWQTRDIELVAP